MQMPPVCQLLYCTTVPFKVSYCKVKMTYFLCLFFTYYLCEKYYKQHSTMWGFLDGSDGKDSTCNERDPRFNPWVRKFPWRRNWQPTPVFLPGEFHRQRSLAGYSSWGCQELGTTEWLTHTIADRVSWVPRLALLNLQTNWTCEYALGMELICM